MIYPDLYALLHSDPEAVRHFKAPPAHARNNPETEIPAGDPESLRQGMTKHPFPLGVYPVFDDDIPRDYSFDNFSAPDLRGLHPYPWGLRQQEEK